MKVLNTIVAGAALFVTAQAYVVELYASDNCSGEQVSRRNVYDNTCAYTDGFKSFRFVKNGGSFQELTAYSRQACAGTTTYQACAAGINSLTRGECYVTDSGSNALSSYSSGGNCPK